MVCHADKRNFDAHDLPGYYQRNNFMAISGLLYGRMSVTGYRRLARMGNIRFIYCMGVVIYASI